MADKNHEARLYETWGPKFRLDVNNPDGGLDGKSVYQLYAFNDDNDIHICVYTYHIDIYICISQPQRRRPAGAR